MRWPSTTIRWLVVLALTAVTVGCAETVPEGDAAPEDRPARVETLWTDAHEWFVEHPLLVVGEAAEIAAHLTSLQDFGPVQTGRLEVALVAADGSVRQRVVAESVARPGIFLPELRPGQPGDGLLRLTYTAASGATDRVDWEVRVAASPEELGEAPPEPEGIAFLKEQQWRIPFATSSVQPAPLRETIELPAGIEAHPGATAVVTAPGTGVFRAPAEGLVIAGETVGAGQVLGRLLPLPESVAGWHTLQAELVEARNRMVAAEREHARSERLVRAGAVPDRRLAEAEAALDNARARLRSVEARVATVEPDGLSHEGGLAVRAPMAGVVAEVSITDGEPTDPERSLFRIVDLERLVVRVEVPELELGRLLEARRRGMLPELALRPFAEPGAEAVGPGSWVSGGRLLELGTEVDPASRTAPVRYELRGAGDRLRPGMSAMAQLGVGPPRRALSVPATALIDLAGAQVVYVQLGGESFEERVVRTGTRDGELVEVVSGLAPGDRVVTRGAYQIRLASLSPDAAPAHSH